MKNKARIWLEDMGYKEFWTAQSHTEINQVTSYWSRTESDSSTDFILLESYKGKKLVDFSFYRAAEVGGL